MHSIIVSAKHFRAFFPKYEKLAAKGVSITIVKRSKPIFKIEPVDISFENQITDTLLDYEENKKKTFVSYDEVFDKK